MQDDNRLTIIEEKLAHLEKYIGDLDEVVRDIAARVDQQKIGVTAVRKMLEDHLNEPEGPPNLADEKPPHW